MYNYILKDNEKPITPHPWEMKIVGFDGYTIDGKLEVRSYKRRGAPITLSIHHDREMQESYRLLRYDEFGIVRNYELTPLRLYFCALSGRDPLTTKLEDFKVDDNGRVMVKIKNRNVFRKVATPEEQQVMRLDELHKDNLAQWKAVKEQDNSELFERMICYKPVCVFYLVGRFSIKILRAEELFSEAMHRVITSILDHHRCYGNLLSALIWQCKFMVALKEAV